MRVFAQLCLQARRLGARHIVFTAELDEALADVELGQGTDRAWCCIGGGAVAWGRTGEEALRRLVDMLEAR